MFKSIFYRSIIELSGTAILSITVIKSTNSSLSIVEASIFIGLTLSFLIHLFGRISGAHFNPLVTLMFVQLNHGNFWFKNKLILVNTIIYIIFQIIGATIVFLFYPLNDIETALNVNLLSECLLTFIFLSLIKTWSEEGKICPESKPLSGIVVGLGLIPILIFGGLNSSGILNPAIAIGIYFSGATGINSILFIQIIILIMIYLTSKIKLQYFSK